MTDTVRIASFNAENLFERSKIFEVGASAQALEAVVELNAEIERDEYDTARIEELYGLVKDLVEVEQVHGKLLEGDHVVARGRGDWVGWIVPRRERFDDQAIANTARVLRDVDADVLCLVEVESLPVLRHFGNDLLRYRKDGKRREYPHAMLIDSKDPRGIELGLMTQPGFAIRGVQSHADEGIFSRDCPEVQIELPGGPPLWVLLNHFKSDGYGDRQTNDRLRTLQAQRVAGLLITRYDLEEDLVVVAGDLNATRDSESLKPLLAVPNLVDILAVAFPDPADRWTCHRGCNEQLDYLLVSRPLAERFKAAGIERRGIHDLARYSTRGERPYDTVTSESNSASNHAAVWADFAM
ncbi:MAG TPA: endonuclease/exonuclease/phosphatase family protein [Kofleriaceae bacterium]|nr:endonuclease/exonuclease/phosphatase family protein [Kofleriaceae bacterium]